MPDLEIVELFTTKAQESLAGAESEFANGRYNNCVNRCYYACFQSAIAVLTRHDFRPSGLRWTHSNVQSQFAGELVNRRKLYPAALRDTLTRSLALRQRGDYEIQQVSQVSAARGLRSTRDFIDILRAREVS